MNNKKLYSPKIHNSLIPSVYYTALDRGIPMTDLVNGYVYRGLATESIPGTALEKLPEHWNGSLTDGVQRYLPEETVNGQRTRLIDIINERAKWAVPFEDPLDLDAWREQSIDGLVQAYASVQSNLHAPGVQRDPSDFNQGWLYETYALNVQAAYADALPHVLARSMRIHYDLGGGYGGRVG